MTCVLNVAEKAEVAKKISNILSNGSAPESQEPATRNKVFNFVYSIPSIGRCQMSFASVSGHINNIDFRIDYKFFKSSSPADYFKAPIVSSVIPSKFRIKDQLQKNCIDFVCFNYLDRLR